MSERKNIDKLFQEKFKDFEVDPPEHSWPELEKRLKKKKDRKIIPFWWRLSGVAAALLLGLFIGSKLGLFDNGTQNTNSVVIEEHAKEKIPGAKPRTDSATQAEKAVAEASATDSVKETSVAEIPSENEQRAYTPEAGNQNGANGNKSGVNNKKFNKIKSNHQEAIVKTSESGNNNSDVRRNAPKINQKTNIFKSNETAVAENKRHSNSSGKKQEANKSKSEDGLENQHMKTIKSDMPKNTTAVAHQNTTDAKSSQTDKSNPQSPLTKDGSVDAKANSVAENEEKNQEKKLDSTAIATVVPNALEELLNEKENKITKEPKLNRWQITSNVAPIYFGSTSGGSPIDSTFSGNSKDYNTQVSYGIGVNYALNKKFTIRTGVNKVSLNYDTNDVLMYASLNEGGLSNLDSPGNTDFLNFGKAVVANRATMAAAAASRSEIAASGDIATDKFSGSINQRMGYIEVPVEVSYAVIDKKFGVNVIAGMSTLFLNENKVVVTAEGLTTDLGEANNLNSTHFSTNIGLGVKYTFLKSFQANFEPIFKYQLNTFSKDSGDFKPYFFGLYTGVSFRF